MSTPGDHCRPRVEAIVRSVGRANIDAGDNLARAVVYHFPHRIDQGVGCCELIAREHLVPHVRVIAPL